MFGIWRAATETTLLGNTSVLTLTQIQHKSDVFQFESMTGFDKPLVVLVTAVHAIIMNIILIWLTLYSRKYKNGKQRYWWKSNENDAGTYPDFCQCCYSSDADDAGELRNIAHKSREFILKLGHYTFRTVYSTHPCCLSRDAVKTAVIGMASVNGTKDPNTGTSVMPRGSVIIVEEKLDGSDEVEIAQIHVPSTAKQDDYTVSSSTIFGAVAASTLFLLRVLAFGDIGHLTIQVLLVWFLQLDSIDRLLSRKLKFDLECRLQTMLGVLCCMIGDWALVLYGLERTFIIYQRKPLGCLSNGSDELKNPTRLCAFNLTKLKIAVYLATTVLFSGMLNYLWLVGEMVDYSVDNSSESTTVVSRLECTIRSEFYNFYYGFLIYFENILTTLLPHAIVLGCTFSIFSWYICHYTRRIGKCINLNRAYLRNPVPQTCDSLTKINAIFLLIFIINVFARIGLSAIENLNKELFIFFKIPPPVLHVSFSMELFLFKFAATSTTTVIILTIGLCVLRRRTNSPLPIVSL